MLVFETSSISHSDTSPSAYIISVYAILPTFCDDGLMASPGKGIIYSSKPHIARLFVTDQQFLSKTSALAAEECLVTIAPDYKGRIGSINSTLFTYDYIGSRVLQRSHYVSGGNINVNYAYDNLGRVTDIASSDGTIDFDYTYAAGENNIGDIAFNHRTSTPSNDFVYDNLDRLYSVEYLDDTADTEEFDMDLLGNRTNVNLRDGSNEKYVVDPLTNRYESIGMTSYWPLDSDDSGVTDEQVSDNDATLYGTPSWASETVNGQSRTVLDVNGSSDYLKTADTTSLIGFAPNSFSVSLWAKVDAISGWKTLLEYDRYTQTGTNWFGLWISSTGKFHFRVGSETLNSNTTLNASQWYYFTAVYDDSTGNMSVYIDGQFDSSYTKQSSTYYNSASDERLTIGTRNDTAAEFFDGKIDDVRIFNLALTDKQILSIYNRGTGDMIAYDDAGNLIVDHRGYAYTYDHENRIETIKRSDSSTIVTYTYDALGRRIKMVDAITPANSRYYYFSDNWQVLEEYSVETTPVIEAYYVWGNYIDELLFIWNGDNTLAAHALQDHLFSTVALVDVTDGTVLERYEYNAYGKVSFLNPTTYAPLATQASTVGNPYTFTGRRLDILDNGNYKKYHYRHRDYDADTGRFLQKDPLGIVPDGDRLSPFNIFRQYVDGMNVYVYTISNPTQFGDPLGLSWRQKAGLCSLYRNDPWHTGHQWIECGTKSKRRKWDFWKTGAVSHAAAPIVHTSKVKLRHHYRLKRGGKFKYGTSKGTKCKCGTAKEIYACLDGFVTYSNTYK